ncbi:hypothetical protein O181_020413 [Austropuccinia psidii MF-1]|uniref:Uncharacterized protein n=1 Tax=Austropuccinia psidii MF-1 TaxID=1389203 RepID=A0A9Q3GUH4_9BASI|nr:hypothetical protein [Austropuccinia psidii MF-1]
MPVQHSPPERQKKPQARAQAVLTPTPRASLDGTPAVPQLSTHLDRGKNYGSTGEDGEEEEESDGTEVLPAPVEESQVTRGKTLA